jgi:hypothetical protein
MKKEGEKTVLGPDSGVDSAYLAEIRKLASVRSLHLQICESSIGGLNARIAA